MSGHGGAILGDTDMSRAIIGRDPGPVANKILGRFQEYKTCSGCSPDFKTCSESREIGHSKRVAVLRKQYDVQHLSE
jgi:hypothetical protein